MKKLKSLLALTVAGLMMLSMVACGEKKDEGTPSSDAPSTEQTSSETPKKEPTGEALTKEQYDDQVAQIMTAFTDGAEEMAKEIGGLSQDANDEQLNDILKKVVATVDSMDKAISDLADLNAPEEYKEAAELFKTASTKMSDAVKVYHEAIEKEDEAILADAQTKLNDAVSAFQTAGTKYAELASK